MLSNILAQPFTFWIFIFVFAVLVRFSAKRMKNGLGLPLLATNFTVFFWYAGDVLYNPYDEIHQVLFDDFTLAIGWIQVSVFLVFVCLFTSRLYKKYRREGSRLYYLYRNGCNYYDFQMLIQVFYKLCMKIWIVLVIMAAVALGYKVIYFVFPYLGVKVWPFARPQIGGGLSFIYSLAHNFHILVAAGFGLVAALSLDKKIRRKAIFLCVLIWPYFLLSRTRNTMLIVVLPALLSYVFIMLRISNKKRVIMLLLAFLFVNFWFSFVLATRSQGQSIYRAVFNKSSGSVAAVKETRHLGLNMFEELSWLNTMVEDKSFSPNWGQRYFADLANPVPRVIWKNKPTIGLDYAIARGQHVTDGRGTVSATISTGMIGGGVNNFGRVLGPPAAALLLSLWLVFLARMDINQNSFTRVPLVLCGLIVVFNLGRDITLLAMYPVLFGWLAIEYFEWRERRKNSKKWNNSRSTTNANVIRSNSNSPDAPAAPTITEYNYTPIQKTLKKISGEASEDTSDSVVTELVFVDYRAPHAKLQINDLTNNACDGINFKVITINEDDNGIDVVSDTLQKYQNISNVHLISLETDGNLQLGTQLLKYEVQGQRADTLTNWLQHIANESDILIYGYDTEKCDIYKPEEKPTIVDEPANIASFVDDDDATVYANSSDDREIEPLFDQNKTFDSLSLKSVPEFSVGRSSPARRTFSKLFAINQNDTFVSLVKGLSILAIFALCLRWVTSEPNPLLMKINAAELPQGTEVGAKDRQSQTRKEQQKPGSTTGNSEAYLDANEVAADMLEMQAAKPALGSERNRVDLADNTVSGNSPNERNRTLVKAYKATIFSNLSVDATESTVEHGTVVHIKERNGDWYKIEVPESNVSGFIHSSMLDVQ